MDTPTTHARRIAAAKLSPRLSSPRPVPRTTVVDQMHACTSAALVLVHGPAGFGKSTVMLQYFAQLRGRDIATSWLTLDRADNEPDRFLRYMVAALRAIDPGLPSPLDEGSAAVAGDGEVAVLSLAEHLASFQRRFVFFIDDFETIDNPAVLGLVRQLIDYLPAGAQLVIGTRTVPELGLGRLRAHGKLLEIKPAELRFSSNETASFLRQQGGLALRNDHILRLQERTQGWPAALWLVSLALRDRGDPQAFVDTFDGSNASIADYLVEDVLARQPENVRWFLLRSSVLHTFNAALCDHVFQRQDSRELLAQVERAHLFLVPQDQERSWFRYHPLFSGFLRAQLAQTASHEMAALHRRAAAWWLDEGQPTRAIEYALHGGDADYLVALLSAHAATLLWQGRARTLARWWSVPQVAERLRDDARLTLVFAWALTLTHRYGESLQLLEGLEAPDATIDRRALPAAVIHVPRAFILAMTDRVKESLIQWRACLPEVTQDQPFTYAMTGASYGYCLVAESRFDEARGFLLQTQQQLRDMGASFIASMSLCLEGAIDFAQGRLGNAISIFRAALAGGSLTQPSSAAGGTVAAAFLAEALYERNALDEAENLLKAYLPLLREAAAPDQLISSYAVLARIAMARGDPERAASWHAEMEAVGHSKGLARLLATARLERARQMLLQGRLDLAQDQLQSGSDERTWAAFAGLVTHANDVEAPLIAEFRWRIHSGRAESVVVPLKHAIKQAQGLQRHRRALKLQILLAEAQCQSGQPGQAAMGMRGLREALQFGAREGFVRSFVDEGQGLARRIADLRASEGSARDAGPQAQALRDFMDRIVSIAGVAPLPAVESAPAVLASASTQLSERELQVLRLLAGGQRNRDIADGLFVSETTVKAHLRSINVKLGTRSRTHALAVGRQLGLIA